MRLHRVRVLDLFLRNTLILLFLSTSNGEYAEDAAQVTLASVSAAESEAQHYDAKTKFIDNLIRDMTIPEMGEYYSSCILIVYALYWLYKYKYTRDV
jgi:hypothetical protein